MYIAALEGNVPAEMVCTFHEFLEFCCLVHCHVIMEQTLEAIEEALGWFHRFHQVFRDGKHAIVNSFLLFQQHAAKHYPELI